MSFLNSKHLAASVLFFTRSPIDEAKQRFFTSLQGTGAEEEPFLLYHTRLFHSRHMMGAEARRRLR
ncbi:hypothetical protein B4113_1225 [Geobacillus sp. B4113_201601]|nr:hypothetical protein B4113_1225 [Geobacillus sp. B4113_201601]